MDRKSIVILVFSIIGLIAWFPLVNKYYPPQEQSRNVAENQDGAVITDPGNTPQAGETVFQSSETAPAVTRTPAVAISTPQEPAAVPQDESLLIWENDNLAYEFTSAGGGIKTVILKKYQETTKCNNEESEEAAETDHVRLNVNVPTPALNLFFGKLDNGFLPYTLRQEGDEILAEYLGPDGIRVLKTFQPGTNYVIEAKITIENTSYEPKVIPEHYLVTGTATPTKPTDTGMYMGMRYHNGEGVEEIK